jgi:phospholipid/cholesterol/gamma-HCH transport system permease protein
LKIIQDKDILRVELSGDYISFDDEKTLNNILKKILSKEVSEISFDINNLEKWNSVFLSYLFDIVKTANSVSVNINLKTLPDNIRRLLELASPNINTTSNSNSLSKEKIVIENDAADNIKESLLESVGDKVISYCKSFKEALEFLGNVVLSIFRFISGTAVMRKIDLYFALEDCSYKALPIVSLISFMVGLILAFVGAVQLRLFGAEVYVASLVSIGMVRIMGAVMTGIIIAGRTGASYAATIGTMKVNEEVDALKTMGISAIDFLVLPRTIALVLMMPLLTVFSDVMGIIGGASVGTLLLDIAPQEYWRMTVEYLKLDNFMVGLFHGFVFGWVISLCSCYYGLKCERSADGVGKATTGAVVSSIVWLVITTGIITFILEIFKL